MGGGGQVAIFTCHGGGGERVSVVEGERVSVVESERVGGVCGRDGVAHDVCAQMCACVHGW